MNFQLFSAGTTADGVMKSVSNHSGTGAAIENDGTARSAGIAGIGM